MATQSSIFIGVVDLNGNEVFPQLEGIEKSLATRTFQAIPGNKIKMSIRFPNDVQLHGAGGFRTTIAIGHNDEQLSQAQTYWYDAVDIKSTKISHACFYVWPVSNRTQKSSPVEQSFTMPVPQQNTLNDDDLMQCYDIAHTGCIVVSMTRANLDTGRAENRSSDQTPSKTEPYAGMQMDFGESPKVVCKDWIDTLPGDHGKPLVWVFRNEMPSESSDIAMRADIREEQRASVTPIEQENHGVVSMNGVRPTIPDGEDNQSHRGNDNTSAEKDLGENGHTNPERHSTEDWTIERALVSDEDIEAALWASHCDFLKTKHPKEFDEMMRALGEQQRIEWLKEHMPLVLEREARGRAGQIPRRGSREEMHEVAQAMIRSRADVLKKKGGAPPQGWSDDDEGSTDPDHGSQDGDVDEKKDDDVDEELRVHQSQRDADELVARFENTRLNEEKLKQESDAEEKQDVED